MNILIAGLPEKTMNYEAALKGAGARFEVGFLSADETNGKIPTLTPESFDGLVLPGGSDIDPAFFHQTPNGAKNIDRETDLLQLQTLDAFVKAQKPVLGICKGLQIINIYFGGTLIQHIKTADVHQSDHEDMVHPTWAAKNSFLYHLYGPHFPTNSAHHQAVGRLGRGLHIVQETADHVAEAVAHESLPIRAVQWHPERMCMAHSRPDTVNGMAIFELFLERCRRL